MQINIKRHKVLLAGTIPGKHVIVKPFYVDIRYTPTSGYTAMMPGTFASINATAATEGEALAQLKAEIGAAIAWTRSEAQDLTIAPHYRETAKKLYAVLTENIVPQGSERAKK